MILAQSGPGLGKGYNPLQGYRGDARSLLPLSHEEEEAERLYYAVVSSSLTKHTFQILAKDLARRSEDAGAYLTWLIYRGHQWPNVAAGGVKGADATVPGALQGYGQHRPCV